MTESINSASYTVSRKSERKNALARVSLVCAYILFGLAYSGFFIAIRVPQLIAILPILLWMAVFFTWKYVSYDICYIVDAGNFYVEKEYGRKKKFVFSCHVREAEEIAPLNRENSLALAKAGKVTDLRGSASSPDSYYIKCKTDGKIQIVYFEATTRMVKLLYRLNEKTEISKGLRF